MGDNSQRDWREDIIGEHLDDQDGFPEKTLQGQLIEGEATRLANESKPITKSWSFSTLIFLACIFAALTVFLTENWQYPQPDAIPTESGQHQLILKQNHQGHYLARGLINGQEVNFMLDTGATHVAIPARIAEQLDLSPGSAVWVNTANGRVQGFQTRLDAISLGDIKQANVRGTIVPGMHADHVLLGMSFLKNLTLVQEQGILTIHP